MSPLVVVVALFGIVLWGGSAIGTKVAVAELSPVLVACLRTVLGGLVALPIGLALGVPLPRGRRQIAGLAVSAACGYFAFPLFFSLGMQRTSGIHGSMILAMVPIATGAIAHLVERRRPAGRWWLGCAIALAGELLLISLRATASGGEDLVGDLLVGLAGVFGAIGYVAGGRLKQTGYPAQGTTYWGIVFASLPILPLLPSLLAGVDVGGVSLAAWAGVAYLAVGVSVIGYVAWYWALGRGGIARVGVFQFLQPVSGVILAVMVLGESLTPAIVVAAATIGLGVWIGIGGGAARGRT
ncbi:DMT family transporter [Siculibacillus lacustris]|uniref:DMT family transporter n=1 Tax=Siculibacillus lacustris TaxID=1549641 RepID=A0A4Q9VSQ5_9HYPH|nr:DMT family transporter [Siculibacillus lacustris]TBW38696.1 DMT family transporter [Siculibacillus lacustris]